MIHTTEQRHYHYRYARQPNNHTSKAQQWQQKNTHTLTIWRNVWMSIPPFVCAYICAVLFNKAHKYKCQHISVAVPLYTVLFVSIYIYIYIECIIVQGVYTLTYTHTRTRAQVIDIITNKPLIREQGSRSVICKKGKCLVVLQLLNT